MVDYSDRLRLTLQEDGSNPNTWGQVVNSQIVELLDEAVAGITSIAVLGTTNVDLTSEPKNGLTDKTRFFALRFTGTLTGTITCTFPNFEKSYIIFGDHSGGIINLKVQGGSEIVPLNPEEVFFVYCDGTEVRIVSKKLTGIEAASTSFNPSGTNLVSTNVQNAIAELDGRTISGPSSVTTGRFVLYDGSSGRSVTQSTGVPGGLAYLNNITDANFSGVLSVAKGGTGSSSLSFPASSITSGTLAVARGGTGGTGGAIGYGQTWYNASVARTHSTSYQNTTGKPIMVSITGRDSGSTRDIEVSSNGSTWVTVAKIVTNGNYYNRQQWVFIVPPSHYYRINGACTIESWAELL